MKSTIQNLLFIATIFMLTSAFTERTFTSTAKMQAGISTNTLPTIGGVYIVFANKREGNISKKEIQSQTEVKIEGCNKNGKIVRYTLQVTKSGKISNYDGNSGVLTKTMMTALNGLSVGDSFEFKDMRANIPEFKEVINVHAAKFTVVTGKA